VRHIDRNALVPYTAAQMYALVADIASYREFLPWCQDSVIISGESEIVTARLKVGFESLNTEFTTVNTLQEPTSMDMRLQDGPFQVLEGKWVFQQLGDQGCSVTLNMQFEFSNSVQDMLMGASFERICDQLIDAFIQRAKDTFD
jgi:ribosome-associated toxin RatA of RatAB toxin-antitoxin module